MLSIAMQAARANILRSMAEAEFQSRRTNDEMAKANAFAEEIRRKVLARGFPYLQDDPSVTIFIAREEN